MKPAKKKRSKKRKSDRTLFLHATGQWAKKVLGKMHYFGTDEAEALKRWDDEKDALRAGRTPRLHQADRITVRELANRFLDSKRLLMDSGELSPVSWRHYHMTFEALLGIVGKNRIAAELQPSDFENIRAELAKTRGAHALAGVVQRIRSLFNYAWEREHISKPVRFGTFFRKPSKKTMRKARNAAGTRMIEVEELQTLLAAAGTPMKAMMLLGINCGFGQSDVANLPVEALDLDRGWVIFPRPKTEILRRCPLWPETVEAIRAAISKRPKAKDRADVGLVFITKHGKKWVRVRPRPTKPDEPVKPGVPIDSVRLEFDKLLTATDLKRPRLGFYALRHVFRTVADGAKDQPAIDLIMGHADESMADLYRERIDDARLKAVVKVVRDWLNAKPKKNAKAK